ncbi:ribosome hibernation-promoting factor, HPF/YfiA family [Mangrovibacterium marinum]|uniref:Putative sigma-54 modulation protein n=1 Tax=Mangrovibacterium marinum TaxID=1639118 RepID=A0A2T5BZC2_9BACT|nr:ribosome-associated translation inhibitor RaiA [Mangrovibacterium marinum]PTN07619.1 putative sigma-54 modulation protein [Mangrovibacterium marinum]
MNVTVNAIHFTADQKLVDFAVKKTSKLDTFFDGIISAEVVLKVVRPEIANNKLAEIKISIPSADYLFAKKQGDSFEEAIDLSLDALKKQLSKFKEKLKEK